MPIMNGVGCRCARPFSFWKGEQGVKLHDDVSTKKSAGIPLFIFNSSDFKFAWFFLFKKIKRLIIGFQESRDKFPSESKNFGLRNSIESTPL